MSGHIIHHVSNKIYLATFFVACAILVMQVVLAAAGNGNGNGNGNIGNFNGNGNTGNNNGNGNATDGNGNGVDGDNTGNGVPPDAAQAEQLRLLLKRLPVRNALSFGQPDFNCLTGLAPHTRSILHGSEAHSTPFIPWFMFNTTDKDN
jgi:hypothetical protein